MQLASRVGMSRLDLEAVAEDGIDNYRIGKYFAKTFGMIQAFCLEGWKASHCQHKSTRGKREMTKMLLTI